MENEFVKKLCAKQGFENAASHIINNADAEAFHALVEKSEFLFDFVKQNVVKRLQNCINETNYQNLLKFLSVYSYDYEDLIISNLKKYAGNETQQELLKKLKSGTDEEKTYCVKFFENDSNCIEYFRNLAYSDYDALSYNASHALGILNDGESFNNALKNLSQTDEFTVLKAVKFLTAYNDKKALKPLFETMKKSSMPENIACEIIYMEDIFILLKEYPHDTLLLINNLISGLGEVVPISVIFDIRLYELIEHINSPLTLLSIKQKIEQITENDEYLFDEDKTVKEEVLAIKELLNSKPQEYWDNLCDTLSFENNFIFFTLELINELKLDYSEEIKKLINSSDNPTIILKSVEVMKTLNKLQEVSKEMILEKVQDKNIIAIIESYFN